MQRLRTCFLLSASIMASAQQHVSVPSTDGSVMLAAVSRDRSMLEGGLGGSSWTRSGTVLVEPIARITPSGDWLSLPCHSYDTKDCRKFERKYLKQPHTYGVVSADGRGATIHAAPTSLSECYGYNGTGTYVGASIAKSALAAESTGMFADSPSLRSLNSEEATAVRKALAALVPGKLDSVQYLRLFAVQLEGKDMVIIQRAFSDVPAPQEDAGHKLIFAIGAVDQGRFDVLSWKKNVDDEDERILGTIRLKSGRDFLITTVSDPESQTFRVYGLRDGRLVRVYSGGGSSC
ncbi:MAG TPA: hypothetical protein VIJ79_12255 [Acidobacteriaceae bacterium]